MDFKISDLTTSVGFASIDTSKFTETVNSIPP